MRSLNKITDSVNEAVSYEEMKEFLRIDFDDEKTLIKALIKAARIKLENWSGRVFITQTWQLTSDYFPIFRNKNERWWDGVQEGSISDLVTSQDNIPLQSARVQSVDSLITYGDDNVGSTFDSSNYMVDNRSEPARLVLNSGSTWPTGLRDRNAIEINFKSGYGDNSADVPEDIRTAIKMLASSLYEKRCGDGEIPTAVQMIMQSYKIIILG